MNPPANSAPATMPIVFWASLAPCIRLKLAAEKSCSLRNHPSTREGVKPRNTHIVITVVTSPTIRPMTGATTMKTSVFVQPERITAPKPALATAAPA